MDGNLDSQFKQLLQELTSRRLGYNEFNELFNNDITRICEYLENPTKSGFWVLELEWNIKGDFPEFLKERLISQHLCEGHVDEEKTSREETRPSVVELNNIDENNLNKLSFIFKLFHYLTYEDSEKEYPLIKKLSLEDLAFTNSCRKEIKEKFSEAYDYFVQEINFDNFFPTLYANKVFRLKDDFIITIKRNHVNYKEMSKLYVSFNPIPLEKIQVFLSKIGVATNAKMQLVFSPEEKVLDPYFLFLDVSYKYFINQDKIISLLEKSIRGYEDKNYEYCISNLGIIAEDYLTQIYETLFRELLPKKFTMGQTYDLINSSLAKKFQSSAKGSPNINPLYERVSKLMEKDPSEISVGINNEEILKLIRELIYFVQEDQKYILALFDNAEKNDTRISVFPKYLKDNINELIKYRNSISHNSRILVGQYEAQRAAFCCITLLMWWKTEKEAINWKDDQDIIIKKMIERNK